MSTLTELVVGVLIQAFGCYCVGSPLPFYSTTGGEVYSPPPVPTHTEAFFLSPQPSDLPHQPSELQYQPSKLTELPYQAPQPVVPEHLYHQHEPYYPPVYSAVKASYAIPPNHDHSHQPEDYHDNGSQYEFSYQIRDAGQGQEFGHSEARYGTEVRGSYTVLLPDGRRQIVEYTAGPHGYHPVIRYEPAY